MDAKQRRQELKRVMLNYNLKPRDVAKVIERSESTVRNWCAERSDQYAPPLSAVKLLKFELEARKANPTNEKTPATANS